MSRLRLSNPFARTWLGRRAWRVASYVGFLAVGLIDLFEPSRSISHIASEHLAQAWAAMFLTSVLAAIYGTARGNTLVEYVSMPALAGCFVFWGMCIIAYELPTYPNAIAPGFVMFAVAAFVLARFSELNETLGATREDPNGAEDPTAG